MDPTLSTGRFFGETLGRREAPGLTVSEVRFPGGARVPPHAHERPIFNFVLSGGYTECWGSRRLEATSTALLFHPRGLVHSERFSRVGARCLTMEYDPDELGVAGTLRENIRFPRERWGWVAARLRREIREGDDLTPLVLEGLLRVLLGDTSRLADPGPPRCVRVAREILHERFVDPPRLGEIAAAAGVPPGRLARGFRRHMGCTPGEYARRLRVDRARRLIEETDRPLAEVAQAAGFADQSHLTRVFKRAIGVTPGAYRRLDR